MEVVRLCVGKAREVEGPEGPLRTAIFKAAVEGPVVANIDADPAATPQALRLHLLGSCLGLLLQQRGHLVLHACAMALSERISPITHDESRFRPAAFSSTSERNSSGKRHSYQRRSPLLPSA